MEKRVFRYAYSFLAIVLVFGLFSLLYFLPGGNLTGYYVLGDDGSNFPSGNPTIEMVADTSISYTDSNAHSGPETCGTGASISVSGSKITIDADSAATGIVCSYQDGFFTTHYITVDVLAKSSDIHTQTQAEALIGTTGSPGDWSIDAIKPDDNNCGDGDCAYDDATPTANPIQDLVEVDSQQIDDGNLEHFG